MSRRNSAVRERYKAKCPNHCYNPNCKTPADGLEAHHIVPLKHGGEDSEENLVLVCHSCHTKLKLHSRYEEHMTELLTWKFTIETFPPIVIAPFDSHDSEEYMDVPLSHVPPKSKPVKWTPRRALPCTREQTFLAGGIWSRKMIRE
jgi:hypothetical protein